MEKHNELYGPQKCLDKDNIIKYAIWSAVSLAGGASYLVENVPNISATVTASV